MNYVRCLRHTIHFLRFDYSVYVSKIAEILDINPSKIDFLVDMKATAHMKTDHKSLTRLGPLGPTISEVLETLFAEVVEDKSKNNRRYLLAKIKKLASSNFF